MCSNASNVVHFTACPSHPRASPFHCVHTVSVDMYMYVDGLDMLLPIYTPPPPHTVQRKQQMCFATITRRRKCQWDQVHGIDHHPNFLEHFPRRCCLWCFLHLHLPPWKLPHATPLLVGGAPRHQHMPIRVHQHHCHRQHQPHGLSDVHAAGVACFLASLGGFVEGLGWGFVEGDGVLRRCFPQKTTLCVVCAILTVIDEVCMSWCINMHSVQQATRSVQQKPHHTCLGVVFILHARPPRCHLHQFPAALLLC